MRAATRDFRDLKRKISLQISRQVRRFEISDDVSPEFLARLGAKKEDAGGADKIFAPEGLIVEGFADGTNFLKWQRSGNDKRNLFIVEARIGDAADYMMVGATTKTKFYHQNQKPGVPVRYRVYATRGGRVSPHSNDAALYLG